MSILAVTTALILATAPSTTATAQPAVSNAPLVCHVEAVPGSRIGNFKVCMRQSDWDARSAVDRDTLVAMQNRSETFRP